MISKEERKRTKRWIKNHVLPSIFNCEVGNSVTYLPENNEWKIWLQIDFDIPEEISVYQKGMQEDLKQASVVLFMKEKEDCIVKYMKDHFEAKYQPEKEKDYNFTIPFPPSSIVVEENGVYRLMNEEEKQELKKGSDLLAKMVEYDEKLLKDGYYTFVEGVNSEKYYEIDAFRPLKYVSLRARYTFIVPHDRIKHFDPTTVSPIFS